MLPPRLRTIINQINQAIDKTESGADDRSKRAHEAQKEVVIAIQSLADEFKTYQEKQENAEGGKRRREKWTIGSLVVTAFVTIALAYIAWLQAGISDRTDKTLHDTLVAANRAWISVDGIAATGEIAGKEDIVVRVFFTNGGKRPATKIKNSFLGMAVPNLNKYNH